MLKYRANLRKNDLVPDIIDSVVCNLNGLGLAVCRGFTGNTCPTQTNVDGCTAVQLVVVLDTDHVRILVPKQCLGDHTFLSQVHTVRVLVPYIPDK